MSRESDLKILRDMKDEIVEIYTLNEECQKLSRECEQLSKSIEHPEPFSFKKETANTQSQMQHEFDVQWRQSHVNADKYSIIFLIANTAIIAILSIIVMCDLLFDTHIFISQEQLTVIDEKEFRNILLVAQAAVCAALITIPWITIKKGK